MAIGEGQTRLAARIVAALLLSPCIWFMFASFAYGPVAYILYARVDLQPEVGICAMNERPETDSNVTQNALGGTNQTGIQACLLQTRTPPAVQRASMIHLHFIPFQGGTAATSFGKLET